MRRFTSTAANAADTEAQAVNNAYDDTHQLADQAVEHDSPYARSLLPAAQVYALLALADQVERIADALEGG